MKMTSLAQRMHTATTIDGGTGHGCERPLHTDSARYFPRRRDRPRYANMNGAERLSIVLRCGARCLGKAGEHGTQPALHFPRASDE